MARFSDVAKGHKARKPIPFLMPNGATTTIALVPIFGDDEADIIREAREYAKTRGVPEPKDDDPLYQRGLFIFTILRGCLDPDSPEEAPAPFFDGGVDQMMDRTLGLDRSRLVYLYEAQRAWQNEIAPVPTRDMGSLEFFVEVQRHANTPEGVDLPFESWPPSMRRTFVRTMAVTLTSSHLLRSWSGLLALVETSSSEKPVSDTTASEPQPPPKA